ncbi:DNA polymerase Y family protein [uncultured Corynebacterium sp.]|uniref:Y-family DNA polymerase n=1 Tax=uncultured Corynebacterium sp. TaxID=159447 RepID=UPI0025FE1296|nr:DNA polymerase Y family protein [uncultured Corynebacterium sp.]
MRIAALWFPDWPVQAVRLERPEGSVAAAAPVAIARQYRIEVCDAAARAVGVRRGMRVRQAQAVCPELDVVDANSERDGVVFAAIADSLDDVASSIEVLRPGLVAVDAAAAGRFHGSEDRALEMLIDAAARAGVDMRIGVADELATALIAARHGGGVVVPAGGSCAFLEQQPVGVLAAEVSLEVDAALVEHLVRLGVRRLGELAALPLGQVTTRFGGPGRRAHQIACAVPDRRVAPELPAAELAVTLLPEDPIERVDAAAFAARQLAARLHDRLAAVGLACLRLQVVAELEGGTRLERVWRTRDALSEDATADRVRWQLDGWLSQARAAETGGIVGLELNPIDVAVPAADELFGRKASDEQVRRVIARVQSQLGTDKVLAPRAAGGRGIAERVEFVPYGEERDPAPRGTWPGRIPAPLPARLGGGIHHPASRMRLIDAAGAPIVVTAEALLSGEPYAAAWGSRKYLVAGWAGPWPVDEAWWRGGGTGSGTESRIARLQLVGQATDEDIQRAWLLAWQRGSWRVEAAYF